MSFYAALLVHVDAAGIVVLFAPMSFHASRLLSLVVQRYRAFQHGPYLASRWEQEGGANCHHCADQGRGFSVEVGVDDGRGQLVLLRSFVSSEPLED